MNPAADIAHAIARIQAGQVTTDRLARLLAATDPAAVALLRQAAYRVKCSTVGRTVYFRALIEYSNVCAKNCLYCGIRAGNAEVARYTLSHDEVLERARWADAQGYGSLVIQSGERQDAAFVDTMTALVRAIRAETTLGITLSLGEQSESVYRAWFDAGAHRYLLRIETSNPELYRALHPADHRFAARRDCLDALRRIGYQVGTGVMIGLPGQTLRDLANDILFFRDQDIDMIGMGPYLPHAQTPLGAAGAPGAPLDLALNMIAVTRLVLPDINIAATTALQAITDDGRELGLLAGANIIMPNITDTRYRAAYQLYDNKPCLNETAAQCRGCLQARIERIGETIGFGRRGDSPRFARRLARPAAETTP